MSLPDTPMPPRHLLAGSERIVLIDTEGGITLLHPERLIQIDPTRYPFSGEVTRATLLGDHHLAAMWVQREIGIARMAVLDLRQPLVDGPDLPTLRNAMDQRQLDMHQVAGAEWSHILDAEPLAICTSEGELVFCTHKRGIYRIDASAEERWRRKSPEWETLENLPDGQVIVSMVAEGDSIWAFSLGGGYAQMRASDGETIRKGVLLLAAKLERAWHGDGEWMLGLSHQKIARWTPDSKNANLEIVGTQGPVHDALKTTDGWYMTGWREDLVWDRSGLRHEPRMELGMRLIEHAEHGTVVLDNIGRWTPFNADTQ
jgi:hypothetical protein